MSCRLNSRNPKYGLCCCRRHARANGPDGLVGNDDLRRCARSMSKHNYMHVSVYACALSLRGVCEYIYIYTCICVGLCACISINTYLHMRLSIYLYIYTHV